MTEIISVITTVVIAHFLALISPGPDFLLVVRSALRNTRRRAIGVALGIALANGVYITLCIIGVGSAIAHSLWLMITLKIVGGLFLLYIAYHAIKARRSDYAFLAQAQIIFGNKSAPSFFKEFLLGIVSGLSNPKNIIFYLSLFSVILTPRITISLTVGLGIWMTLLVFAWDVMIIFVLSQQRVRNTFGKMAYYIDKVAGALLGFMGYKLLESAIKGTA
ncbi:LysE family translocator [Dentiradicibacter hellwigii]|uniref:LysE family transporter n=1 Tax=Dentiradicibacter hellwigii TaxID=3149053 RepID=A0ABV4UD76_9RHOO